VNSFLFQSSSQYRVEIYCFLFVLCFERMIVARQEPSWASSRISYWSSLQSAKAAGATSNPDGNIGPYTENDDTGSAFSTATLLPLAATSATLENHSTETAAAASSSSGADFFSVLTVVIVSSSSADQSSAQITSSQQQVTTPSLTTSINWTQRSGWHSHISLSTDAVPSATNSAALDTQQKSHHHGADTAVVAGVVVPIMVLLVGGIVFLSCWRRKQRHVSTVAAVASGDQVQAPAVMVEKAVAKTVQADALPPVSINTMLPRIDETMETSQQPRLVITSPQNPTYFTGLDTFSVHSTATTEDPPPPYRTKSVLSHNSSERQQRRDATTTTSNPAFVVPVAPVSPLVAARLESPFSNANALIVERTPSQRSFASTMYSSDASVHEAKSARRSTGPAQYMINRTSTEGESGLWRSPFDDPEDGDSEERENLR
jgi:hypothetical protein